MILAIASGKGGTGKTTVTASLASVWERPLLAVDLDVEEPNLHLFLNPRTQWEEPCHMEIPVVDAELCQRCGACSDLCQFKAISLLGKTLLTIPEMCHGCGGCIRICPQGAIQTGQRELGTSESGVTKEGIPCLTGRLRIGESMSPPLMKKVRQHMRARMANDGLDALIDAPPGVSCPAMTAVQDADALLLVTEPTPFGFHDFQLAYRAFRVLGKPIGVVINRAGLGDHHIHDFCKDQGLPVLAEIPFRRDIAEHYARGGVLSRLDRGLEASFRELASKAQAMALTPGETHA